MVASWMLSGTLLVVLGLSFFSSLAKASPISSETKPNKRGMDMDTNGFYGDTFNGGFGNFETTKRAFHRSPNFYEEEARFIPLEMNREIPTYYHKRLPYMVHKRMDMGLNGFHGDTFSSGFGDFSTAKRKRMSGSSNGFYGDTFSDGFGDFETARRKKSYGLNAFHGDTFSQGFGDFETTK